LIGKRNSPLESAPDILGCQASTSDILSPQTIHRLTVCWSVGNAAHAVREETACTKNPTVQEIKVTVKGEYSPDRIVVKKGRPVRLVFYRDDDSECTAKVDIPGLKIKKDLPVKQETAVELTSAEEGEYTVVCGMQMLKGKLVVQK
jgi:plastocyanin domain-containing protein